MDRSKIFSHPGLGTRCPIFVQDDECLGEISARVRSNIERHGGLVVEQPEEALIIVMVDCSTIPGSKLVAKYAKDDGQRGVVTQAWVKNCIEEGKMLGPRNWGGHRVSPLSLSSFFAKQEETDTKPATMPNESRSPSIITIKSESSSPVLLEKPLIDPQASAEGGPTVLTDVGRQLSTSRSTCPPLPAETQVSDPRRSGSAISYDSVIPPSSPGPTPATEHALQTVTSVRDLRISPVDRPARPPVTSSPPSDRLCEQSEARIQLAILSPREFSNDPSRRHDPSISTELARPPSPLGPALVTRDALQTVSSVTPLNPQTDEPEAPSTATLAHTDMLSEQPGDEIHPEESRVPCISTGNGVAQFSQGAQRGDGPSGEERMDVPQEGVVGNAEQDFTQRVASMDIDELDDNSESGTPAWLGIDPGDEIVGGSSARSDAIEIISSSSDDESRESFSDFPSTDDCAAKNNPESGADVDNSSDTDSSADDPTYSDGERPARSRNKGKGPSKLSDHVVQAMIVTLSENEDAFFRKNNRQRRLALWTEFAKRNPTYSATGYLQYHEHYHVTLELSARIRQGGDRQARETGYRLRSGIPKENRLANSDLRNATDHGTSSTMDTDSETEPPLRTAKRTAADNHGSNGPVKKKVKLMVTEKQ